MRSRCLELERGQVLIQISQEMIQRAKTRGIECRDPILHNSCGFAQGIVHGSVVFVAEGSLDSNFAQRKR